MMSPYRLRNALIARIAFGLDAGRLAAVIGMDRAGGRACRAQARPPERRSGLRLDRLVERQLAVVDLVDAVVREGRIAVLVDRVGAEHALAILRGEQRLEDLLLVARACALDGVEREVHRLVAVDRV